MAKTILGIDIGYDSMKLALMSGKKLLKTLSVPMPKNLMRDGRVVSVETMGDLIRRTMKENGIKSQSAALVLPGDSIFVRNVTMPAMNTDQLLYNLPFEFRDYITDELKDYMYDYAVDLSPDEKEEREKARTEQERRQAEESGIAPAPEAPDEQDNKKARTMDLLAVAVPVSMMEESRQFVRKAGMKLVNAAPAISSYINLIRALPREKRPPSGEFCILDLGYRSVRMFMFSGDRHIVTRVLEIGLSGLDDIIADACNVDTHLAHTYLLTNYDDCQNKDYCINAYNNIAIELMRALNFYRFSNPDSALSDVWMTGGGSSIAPLRAAVADSLDMTLHDGSELIPSASGPELDGFVQAVGIALT